MRLEDYGLIGDLHTAALVGRRNVLLGGLCVFLVASLVGGIAHDGATLIATRVTPDLLRDVRAIERDLHAPEGTFPIEADAIGGVSSLPLTILCS